MDAVRRGVVVMALNGGCSSRVCYSRTLEGRGRRSTIILASLGLQSETLSQTNKTRWIQNRLYLLSWLFFWDTEQKVWARHSSFLFSLGERKPVSKETKAVWLSVQLGYFSAFIKVWLLFSLWACFGHHRLLVKPVLRISNDWEVSVLGLTRLAIVWLSVMSHPITFTSHQPSSATMF